MELDIAPDGRVFYIERDGRVQVIKPDTGTTVDRGRRWTCSPATRTACSASRSTRLRHQQLGLPLLLAERRRRRATSCPGSPSPATRIDLASEKVVLAGRRPSATPAATRAAAWSFDSAGNLYLATGDNTNPFESDGYAPIDERPGRQDFDAQRTVGQHQRPARQGAADPPARPTARTPSRPATCSPPGTAQTRPRSTRWASATRSASASTRRPTRSYVADYGPDAGSGQPEPRPGGHGRVEHRRAARQLRLAVLPSATTTPTTTTRSRPGRAGAKFDCAAPVNNSPNNTGLTNLPPAIAATVDYDYSGNPLFPEIGGGGAPMGGPVYRYDAATSLRPQVAGRTTTARRSSASGTRTRCTRSRSTPTARRWSTSTSC